MASRNTWIRILSGVLTPSGKPGDFILQSNLNVRLVAAIEETRQLAFNTSVPRLNIWPRAVLQPGGTLIGTVVQTGDPEVLVLNSVVPGGASGIKFTVSLAWDKIVSVEVEDA